MHDRSLRPVLRRPEIEQLAAQIIASRRAEKTRLAYSADFRLWLGFCERHAVDAADPLLPHATAFREELLRNYGNASVRRILSTLSLVYRGCLANGAVRRNPFDRVLLPRPEVPRFGTTSLVPQEHADVMIALAASGSDREDLRDHAVLRLLYDVGMRRESVASLLAAHVVCGPRMQLRFRLKGGADHLAVLPQAAAEALEHWLKAGLPAGPGRYVFPAARGGGHMHPITINRIVARCARMANVSHVHPHQFRAAYITDGITETRDIYAVQRSVGHASPNTTAGYDRDLRGDSVADGVAELRARRRV